MKKLFCVLFWLVSFVLLLTGCGNRIADEKQITKDLTVFTGFLEDKEKIKNVEIEKRQTEKDKKIDTVWCEITTEDEECSYQKGVILTYGLYTDGGWILDDVLIDSRKDWIITPIAGIKEDNIPTSLKNKTITINGEIWKVTPKDISIVAHKTNLKDKVDNVTAKITIEDVVQEATGQLILTYIFDDTWKIDSISGEESFEISTLAGKEPDITEEDIIETLASKDYTYGIPENATIYFTSDVQDITIKESEISNFKIESTEITSKGTSQKYAVSCILTKPSAKFAINATITYNYSSSDGWKSWLNNVLMKCTSVTIQGDWTGIYTDIGYKGQATLTIQSISADGEITGTYSYTPDTITTYHHAGSYHVSGKIDLTTMKMKLEAGDWINKPTKPNSFEKNDISARLYVDNSIISGVGHDSNPFDLAR